MVTTVKNVERLNISWRLFYIYICIYIYIYFPGYISNQ